MTTTTTHLVRDEVLIRDQITRDGHRSIASDVVHEDGEVVLEILFIFPFPAKISLLKYGKTDAKAGRFVQGF